jgi:alkaline phosphatase
MQGRRKATIGAAITATLALAVAPVWTDAARQQHKGGGDQRKVAKNVIVLQGDGMATAQRDLIRLVTKGNKPGQELVMNRLEHAGLVHTDPADPEEAVTDSAAAATSFATGVKTFNGAIGVDAQGRPVPTLLEDARKMGGDRPRHHLAGDRRDARRLRGPHRRPLQAERDRAAVPRVVEARRDPRRR